MTFEAGTTIGHYLIRSKIGSGGMGDVYEAEDQRLLRTVAIKFIKRQEHVAEGAGKRFLREARMASQLNHPNIVTIYEICETEEHTYIAMELVRGRNLRSLIRSGHLSTEAALDAAIQTADALAEAHSNDIIHRDIKPENIIINERGRVKLLDFGLAKPLELAHPYAGDMATTAAGIEHLTDSGVVVGTIPYMSPEQIRRDPSLDKGTDVFSFGIVLYEMLTGEHPFRGDNVFVIGAAILSDEAVRTDKLKPELPGSTASLFTRLLEKDRRKRIASFVEIKKELELLRDQLGRRESDGEENLAGTLRLDYSREERRPGSAHVPSASKSAHSWSRSMIGTPTVLVLPFEAVGSSDEATFIGIGLASVITTDLAKISGLSVLSKGASAGRFSEAVGRGTREQARELGANIILEGEVQRAGGRLRITARLIDVESERAIWGEQYRGGESELFEIQDKVCESIAAALKVNISQEVRQQLAHPPTVNLDAFELYSKGRAFLDRRDHEGNIDFAIQMFEEAIRLDANFALAQAGLGEAYWMKYEATKDAAWVKRAESASDRALVLDPNQPQVHISLGIVYHGTGAVENAIEEFQCAVSLQPLNDSAYRWLGRCYLQSGEMELAREHFEKAVEIRPGYWENYNVLGNYYYARGLYEKAAAQYRRVIRIQPDSHHGYNNLGAMYLLLGRYEDAAATHQRAIEIHPAAIAYDNLGTAYFYLERYEEARDAYSKSIELNPSNDVPYRNLGDVLLRLGREDEALENYRLAIGRLKDALTIKSNDAQLLTRLAVCQAKLRSGKEAVENIERAAALDPKDVTTMYKRAVVYSLTGHIEQSVRHLREALARGYSRAEAERDPDLSAIRDDPEYKDLFAV
ncbi:MAG: tetratricopeptide repeat protein [Acidobacteria bacterium]|nr:tetratricopeptide repeat protein [Acidobacteriota bacterium]